MTSQNQKARGGTPAMIPVTVYMMNPTNLRGSAGARSVRVDARISGVQSGCLYVREIRLSQYGAELRSERGVENLVPWANIGAVQYGPPAT